MAPASNPLHPVSGGPLSLLFPTPRQVASSRISDLGANKWLGNVHRPPEKQEWHHHLFVLMKEGPATGGLPCRAHQPPIPAVSVADAPAVYR